MDDIYKKKGIGGIDLEWRAYNWTDQWSTVGQDRMNGICMHCIGLISV